MKFKILICVIAVLILIGCQKAVETPANELPPSVPAEVTEPPAAAETPTEPTTPTEPVVTEPAKEPTTADVEIKGIAGFSPAELKVTAGSTVTWKNSDKAVHKLVIEGKSVNSGNMASGATWSYVFKEAGDYTIFDTSYNKRMKVTVE